MYDLARGKRIRYASGLRAGKEPSIDINRPRGHRPDVAGLVSRNACPLNAVLRSCLMLHLRGEMQWNGRLGLTFHKLKSTVYKMHM